MPARRTLVFGLAAGLACTSVPTDPAGSTRSELSDPGNQTPAATPAAVRLLAPAQQALLPQNDSTIGCPAHLHRGYGLRATFAWEPAGEVEPVAYALHVQQRHAQYAWIDVVVDSAAHTVTSCNGFVIDRNLRDWEWRVRAVSADGEWGPWSETRVFHFEPCRHEDGRRCTAPG